MFKLLRFRILLAVAAILLAMGSVYHAMHTTEGILGGARDEPLASAEFRAPIASLEARLFAAGPLTMAERIALAQAFEDVGKRLDTRGSHLARFSAREVRVLAVLSRGLGDLGGPDLDRVRNNWMRVRANTFDDASWFRFSEADPVAAPEEVRAPLAASDLATVTVLRTVLDRIDDAIGRGEREADRLGEPEPNGTTGPDVAGAWHDWSGDWLTEIERIRGLLPAEPSSSAPFGVRFGWDSERRALDELSAVPGDVPGGGRPPYRVEWTRHLQNARRDADAALDWIEKAERGGV